MKIATAARLSLLLTVLLTPPAFASWPNTSLYNLPVCVVSGEQMQPVSVPDGAGGVLVAWGDSRSGSSDIYVQHILASGEVDPGWPANGRLVCGASGYQETPAIVGDGAGGAIVIWWDARTDNSGDLYAQHVSASGVVDPSWPVNGRALCNAANAQSNYVLVTDGAGGAVAVWSDYRSGSGASDLYAQRVRSNGTVDPAWPVNGKAVCTAAGEQVYPAALSDGAGGVIVTWHDLRSGLGDIYAHRVLATGAPDPAWPANGRAVCALADGQYFPGIASDGAGGAIIAWEDIRSGVNFASYAHRISAAGVLDPSWPANGVLLSTATGIDMVQPAVVSDGAGGAIVVWREFGTPVGNQISAQHVLGTGAVDPAWPAGSRVLIPSITSMAFVKPVTDGEGGVFVTIESFSGGTGYDVYVQHATANGALDPTWPTAGQVVSNFVESQDNPTIVSDGIGGALLCWADRRNDTEGDIYAGRVGRHAELGTPEPMITVVEDVVNDQGGTVRVKWNTSYLDTPSNPILTAFDVYRWSTAGVGSWLLLGSVPATQHFNYAFLAATPADSGASGSNAQAYRVRARDAAGRYWDSRSQSGYSVDNLSPAMPSPFTATETPGTRHLHWNRGTEPDLAGYRLYRSATFPMVRNATTLIATPADTGYADVTSDPWVYQLTAVDAHGNESAPATLFPDGSLDVPGEWARSLEFAPPSPNPAHDEVALRYTLPRAGRVQISVHDAAGRLVRELEAGVRSAGAHAVTWDTRDSGGHDVRAGLYFVHLRAEGDQIVRRVVVTR